MIKCPSLCLWIAFHNVSGLHIPTYASMKSSFSRVSLPEVAIHIPTKDSSISQLMSLCLLKDVYKIWHHNSFKRYLLLKTFTSFDLRIPLLGLYPKKKCLKWGNQLVIYNGDTETWKSKNRGKTKKITDIIMFIKYWYPHYNKHFNNFVLTSIKKTKVKKCVHMTSNM